MQVVIAGLLIGLAALAWGCGGGSDIGQQPTPSPAAGGEETTTALFRGALTLAGRPFDARFLGAVVRAPDGLIGPCQAEIPGVFGGRYEIDVYSDSAVLGCGADGTEVYLWTYVDDERLVSNESMAWPGDGAAAAFDATFSTARPRGGLPETTDFSGEVYDRGGNLLTGGTRVEAYIGDVLCGVTSVRRAGSFTGYIISVVGPDSVAGCDLGATITFRIDGQDAVETAVNGGPPESGGGGFHLTVR